MVAIIRYSDKNETTKKLSLICDGRLIWDGNKTVKEIKKFETKSKNIDIPFSDRYSISLINSNHFLKLPEYKKKILILNFYNDTYNVDQNACSSPHIVLWYGNFFLKAKEIFRNFTKMYLDRMRFPYLSYKIQNDYNWNRNISPPKI